MGSLQDYCTVILPLVAGSSPALDGIIDKRVKNKLICGFSWGSIMSYCARCGAKLEKDAKFCSSCGAKVAKVTTEEYSVASDNLIERVKELLHEGNVTRIIVKNEKDDVLLEIPATIGVIGVVLVPWLAALGAIAALATNCKIVVEKRE
jgi:ribosomal protein L40E